MDGTSNAKRPAALKTSVALGTVGFFSRNEALPTWLSRIFFNPKEAFRGRFPLSREGGPWRVM